MTEEEKEEAALQARDERVSKTLRARLSEINSERAHLREQLYDLDRESEEIREAVNQGHWWELRGLLGAKTIESLCGCHLAPTSSYLDD